MSTGVGNTFDPIFGTRCVMTLSPCLNLVTEGPTEMTSPAPSEPGTTFGIVWRPFAPCYSYYDDQSGISRGLLGRGQYLCSLGKQHRFSLGFHGLLSLLVAMLEKRRDLRSHSGR